MKKLLIIAIASIVAAQAAQAQGTVTIEVDALRLYVGTGPAFAPLSTVGLMVVDKNSDGISNGPLIEGFSLALGATFGGDDNIIVARTTVGDSTGSAGELAFAANFALGPHGVATGQRVAIVWLPHQSFATPTATIGNYGWHSKATWLVPTAGFTVAFPSLYTISVGGSDPESAGYSPYLIIPEPSTIGLVCLGLLGAFGIRRRK